MYLYMCILIFIFASIYVNVHVFIPRRQKRMEIAVWPHQDDAASIFQSFGRKTPSAIGKSPWFFKKTTEIN